MECSLTWLLWPHAQDRIRLNPCSNGMLSDLNSESEGILNTPCLNPCSNGMLSDISFNKKLIAKLRVLILVLMECSLTDYISISMLNDFVLILVLMECSLTYIECKAVKFQCCLNPCSNGMLSDLNELRAAQAEKVLILVLMECSLTNWKRAF